MVRRVVGHSMLPVLPPGTIVVALSVRGPYRPGQVVIVDHEGREKIKRIQDVRPNEVFIVGDNNDASTDSRHFGWLSEQLIRARVVWPRRLR